MEAKTLSNGQACCHRVAAEKNDRNSRYAPFISTHDGLKRITFAVDGIHCARCIWAIESALDKEDTIDTARVNMSTSRLVIEWRGDEALADHFAVIVESLGYPVKPFEEAQKQASWEDRFLLRCVAVAGFAMGNIMLISVALWSSDQAIMGMATRDIFHWASAVIALPTLLYAGRPFFGSAWSVLKTGHTNMDVPISLALILASAMSLFETIHHGEHAYFDSAVMLLFFLLVGRWLDSRARSKARENAQSLLNLMHGTATILDEDGTAKTIAIKDLREGMVMKVATGEAIPTDAVVESGASDVDTSLVTGETLPKAVKVGDDVFGGTINLSAPLTCRISKASDDSLLADIIRLMEQAEQGRARYVRLADKAARLYTPVVHTLAAGAFIGWYFIGGMAWQDALLIAITTLIITCPCALGLAVPVVQVLTSGWLMKRGILVKSGDALERLATIDTILFDKTGTLTQGIPKLQSHDASNAELKLAASLASHSKHPLSQALATAYDGKTEALHEIKEIPAHGMQATWKGKRVQLGKRSWCGDDEAPDEAVLELWFKQEGTEPIRFTFADTLKDDAQETIKAFRRAQIPCHMVTGDRTIIAQHIADKLGIEAYHGDCLPADKTRIITALKEGNHKVLMVGDGLNDAPALTAATVSMSPATGVDITQNTADMVFQGMVLKPVYLAWRIATFSTTLVKQNFALAVLYNCCAIPLALAGYVTPLVAAIAMSSSSLLVIFNSFRINLKHGGEK